MVRSAELSDRPERNSIGLRHGPAGTCPHWCVPGIRVVGAGRFERGAPGGSRAGASSTPSVSAMRQGGCLHRFRWDIEIRVCESSSPITSMA